MKRKNASALAPTLASMDFADRLQAAMTFAGVTAPGLAKAIGVSPQAVKQILTRSSKSLSAANCVVAAQFLQVDVVWLATGEGVMRPHGEEQKMSLSSEERDVIIALRVMAPEARAELLGLITQKAAEQVAALEAIIARQSERTGPANNVLPLRTK